MPETDIPSGSTAVIDTSVLFAMGGPSNEKYRALEQFVTQRKIAVKIPRQVAEELGESPDAYRYQRKRLRTAQEAGWLEPATIDFSNPHISKAVDKTRKRMAKLSSDNVTEDEIERTDTILTGLAYQYATGPANHVTVLVSDRVAEQAITDALTAMNVNDRATVVEGRTLLKKLVNK